MTYLIFYSNPWLLIIVLTVVLILSIELPYRWGQSLVGKLAKNMDAFNAVQGGLLTLASFVLGLSFAQASARYDARRALVVAEANDIGTTWLRAEQLEPAKESRFRRILVEYTAARLQAYETPRNARSGWGSVYQNALDQSTQSQDQMWTIVSDALRAHPSNLGLSLLMQTLNDTIDVSTEQLQALSSHVPTAVVVLTLLLITLGSLSLGIRFAADGARPAMLSAIYVVASVVVVTMMVDYDRPRTGFVTISLDPIKIQLQSMEVTR
jgi:hypothetical protein